MAAGDHRVDLASAENFSMSDSVEERLDRLQKPGLVDLHFDLPMYLYENRTRPNVLAADLQHEFEAGGIQLMVAAIFLEDRYLEDALDVALGQAARLLREIDGNTRFKLCRNFAEIEALAAKQEIGFLLGFEGVEPLGEEIDRLRAFYEMGLRLVGLTHARDNAAASGAIFAASGSPTRGLTPFGREVVRECERLGIIVDLAHLNPVGFDQVLELATKPLVISHTNARRFYDIERNHSDEQFRAVAEKGGVIGVNAVLVSQNREEATLDRYVDHVEHIVAVAGIEHVAIGFDFIEFIRRRWSEADRQEFEKKYPSAHSVPDLAHHGHATNLTRRLIERGFSDEQIEKILRGNWRRILRQLL